MDMMALQPGVCIERHPPSRPISTSAPPLDLPEDPRRRKFGKSSQCKLRIRTELILQSLRCDVVGISIMNISNPHVCAFIHPGLVSIDHPEFRLGVLQRLLWGSWSKGHSRNPKWCIGPCRCFFLKFSVIENSTGWHFKKTDIFEIFPRVFGHSDILFEPTLESPIWLENCREMPSLWASAVVGIAVFLFALGVDWWQRILFKAHWYYPNLVKFWFAWYPTIWLSESTAHFQCHSPNCKPW